MKVGIMGGGIGLRLALASALSCHDTYVLSSRNVDMIGAFGAKKAKTLPPKKQWYTVDSPEVQAMTKRFNERSRK